MDSSTFYNVILDIADVVTVSQFDNQLEVLMTSVIMKTHISSRGILQLTRSLGCGYAEKE
eukprot:14372138-Ditylum_brightwellii.AAC.1